MKIHRVLLPAVLLLLVCQSLTAAAAAVESASVGNALRDHPSPYLAMHGQDPVHWQPWGPAVLARARAEQRLILVSSGYFACHWCHVMQRESYQNPAIAALLNAAFITVKVDRELHPALDARLIDFVQRTRGQAGWPLNVFLTPQGHPLLGLTYLPPEQFLDLLENLQQRWKDEAPQLQAMASRAAQALISSQSSRSDARPSNPPPDFMSALTDHALARADELGGGFGQVRKFPHAAQLLALLEVQQRRPAPRLADFLQLTLKRMAGGGMQDHLRGGFFRYTVDPDWQLPHFEKMLYDNALLVRLYLRAAEVLAVPAFTDVARRSLDFLLRDMSAANGGFVASLSAVDVDGVEGGYYLWQGESLRALLDEPQWAVAQLYWGLETVPALEAGHLLVPQREVTELASQLTLPAARVQQELAAIRERVRTAREVSRLPVDDKVLASWNGLTLQALVAAALSLDDRRYQQAATDLRHYLQQAQWRDGRLLRAAGAASTLGETTLEDYAQVALGVWSWAEAFGGDADRRWVRQLVEQAWALFYNERGWLLGADGLLPDEYRQSALEDDSLPSAAASLLEVSQRVARHFDLPSLQVRINKALEQSHSALAGNPFWHASYLRPLLSAGQTGEPKSAAGVMQSPPD